MSFLKKLFGEKVARVEDQDNKSFTKKDNRGTKDYSLQMTKMGEHAEGVDVFSVGIQFVASTCNRENDIFIWESTTGIQKGQLQGHTAKVTGLALSRIGDRLISASKDNTICLWDTIELKKINSFNYDTPVSCIVYDSARGRAVIGGENGLIRIIDLSSGQEVGIVRLETVEPLVKLYEKGPGQISHLTISSDGTQLAAIVNGWNAIILCHLGERIKVDHFPVGHHLFSICFSLSDEYILACGGSFKFSMDASGNITEMSSLDGILWFKKTSSNESAQILSKSGSLFESCGWLTDGNKPIIQSSVLPFKGGNFQKTLFIPDLRMKKLEKPIWKADLLPGYIMITTGTFSPTGSSFGMKVKDSLYLWHID